MEAGAKNGAGGECATGASAVPVPRVTCRGDLLIRILPLIWHWRGEAVDRLAPQDRESCA